MRYLISILAIYVAGCLQTSVVEAAAIEGIGPDFLALAAAAALLLTGGNGALLLVAVAGLVEDLISPGRLGVATGWYLISGWGLLALTERFGPGGLLRRIASTGLFVSMLACGIGLTRFGLGEPTAGPLGAIGGGMATGLYTAAVSLPVWMAIGWIEHPAVRRAAQYDL